MPACAGMSFVFRGKRKPSGELRPEPGKFESSLGLTAIRVHVVELPSSQAAISLERVKLFVCGVRFIDICFSGVWEVAETLELYRFGSRIFRWFPGRSNVQPVQPICAP